MWTPISDNHQGNSRRKQGTIDDMYSIETNLINKSLRELEDGGDRDPISKLRLLCMTRGATGLLGVARQFRLMDHDKGLGLEEFSAGIRDYGLNINTEEIKQMFERFDETGSGFINMTDFLVKLRPPINEYRLGIIVQAFEKADKQSIGKVSLNDLRRVYSVKDNQQYKSGELTKDEILNKFLHNFEDKLGKPEDVMITKEEFVNYYAALSASIDDDMCFDLTMRRAYNL